MSEQTLDKPQSPEQLSEILLVFDKEKKKIQAVKGIDENGNLETVEPTKKKIKTSLCGWTSRVISFPTSSLIFSAS